jgi:hypothetical protein
MIWRPYLPEPRPAFKWNPQDPEPVPLTVLKRARDFCAKFRVPPRQFRRRTATGALGSYWPKTDIVAVDQRRADADGLGGDDGYYATMIHELLHATGHPRRLGRPTTGDYSREGYDTEEKIVNTALRIVLAEIGFPQEAIDRHTYTDRWPTRDQQAAAERAAAWFLNPLKVPATRQRGPDHLDMDARYADDTRSSAD